MIKTKFTYKLLLFGVLFALAKFASAQNTIKKIEGEISYITGSSIYVKFQNTSGIEKGDTLFIQHNNELLPALLVLHKSSISCLCNSITDQKFSVGDNISGWITFAEKAEFESPTESKTEIEKDINEQVLTSENEPKSKPKENENLNGRISISSYSNLSNSQSDDTHRFRYTLSMEAKQISGSNISAETYLSFSHKLKEWAEIQENINNGLKVYSLALNYSVNEKTNFWLGRKINPKIANVGAIDGLQFQKEGKYFFIGAAAGTRPDYSDYGFNPQLLEYGFYVGQNSNVKNGFLQTSLAFFEQRNTGKIDRRFVYFQHTNSYFKKMNIFSSFEIDLYKLENDQPQNTISLTSLYFSLNYRISQKISLSGSYDNRKNVIYYETFRNYADEIIQQASRQGIRLRVNYKPFRLLSFNVNAGTRFRKEDPQPAKTLRTVATYSQIPGLKAALSFSANLMQTSYLNGEVYGARLSKNFVRGKLYTVLNYRLVNFNYATNASTLKQHISELDFSYQFNKKIYLSVNLENTFQKDLKYNRVYVNLRKRF